MSTLYDLETRTLEGEPIKLDHFRGKVSLVVNVASACGNTPQYAGLQDLYEKYRDRGLAILGFPSNDFGRQEPGSAQEIRSFCESKYKITFPMFEKISTKAGEGQSPVYAALGAAAQALPNWNFGKYLVDREGNVVRYFAPSVEPQDPALVSAIETALRGSA